MRRRRTPAEPGRRAWVRNAKCRGTDPQSWDVVGINSPKNNRRQDTLAAMKCAGCPVKLECALDAIHHRDIGVIRAGVPLRGETSGNGRQGKNIRKRLQAVVLEEQKRSNRDEF